MTNGLTNPKVTRIVSIKVSAVKCLLSKMVFGENHGNQSYSIATS
jgi:hypothetical protein